MHVCDRDVRLRRDRQHHGRPNGTHTQSLAWSPEGQLGPLTAKSGSGAMKSTTGHLCDADGTVLIRRNTRGDTVLYLADGTEVHLDTSTSTAKYGAQRYYNASGQVNALCTNKTGAETLSWLASDQHGTSSMASTPPVRRSPGDTAPPSAPVTPTAPASGPTTSHSRRASSNSDAQETLGESRVPSDQKLLRAGRRRPDSEDHGWSSTDS
ncbi:hypothetical protein GCM10010276_21720 [Streptomyces longisporus]|uniref:Uncharacterized protein n=1 Tax=Streptomyces longisporus TaxID=1948 RepID=A0ABN3LJT8_STRLO